MQGMLRSCSRLAKGLACWAPRRCTSWVAASDGIFLHPPHTSSKDAAVRWSHSGQPKDYSLPNSSWSQDMMDQFHKFTELSKEKTWKKLPSYRLLVDHIPGMTKEEIEEAKKKSTRFFLRNLDIEGAGFEYFMFVNPVEKRLVCIFQPGPYLEGTPGFAHGGAIATVFDCTLWGCAVFPTHHIMTANLNINYKSPIPLGSVVLADCKLDRVEGRKVFVSGRMQSADGQTLHAEATELTLGAQSRHLESVTLKTVSQIQSLDLSFEDWEPQKRVAFPLPDLHALAKEPVL